jgi:hypothetical protein
MARRLVTIARIREAVERAARSTDNPGFCIDCGIDVGGVEPDAQGDPCEACGSRNGVWGAEQLLIEREI